MLILVNIYIGRWDYTFNQLSMLMDVRLEALFPIPSSGFANVHAHCVLEVYREYGLHIEVTVRDFIMLWTSLKPLASKLSNYMYHTIYTNSSQFISIKQPLIERQIIVVKHPTSCYPTGSAGVATRYDSVRDFFADARFRSACDCKPGTT